MNQALNPNGSIVKRGHVDKPPVPSDFVMKGRDGKNDEELIDAICSSVELEKLSQPTICPVS